MKVTEVRGHHTTEMQSKRSRIREGITFCLGLAMACGIGIYIGHTAGEEAKQLENSASITSKRGKPFGTLHPALPAIVMIFGRSYMNYRQSTTFPAQRTCIPANG